MKFCPMCGTRLVDRLVHGHDRPACPSCGFIHYAGPKVAVGVVVFQEDRLLLNRRAIDPGKGLWSFPSGYVDLGESTTVAALREVKEETGFDVRLDGLLGVYSATSRPVVFVVYTAEIVGGFLVECDEVEAIGFYGIDELPALAFDHDPQIVRDGHRWRARRTNLDRASAQLG